MEWKNTNNGELPINGQTVLVNVKGVNYIAEYDHGKKLFRVNDEPIETFFRISEYEIAWAHDLNIV